MPEKFYTIKQVAEWLNCDVKTIRRYLKAEMWENLLIIQRPKRNRTLFSQQSIDAFRLKYGAGLTTPERPKRTYNKRVVKGKHKKKGK